MAEVWPRRLIDFHSQAVNGGKIRRELRTGADLTVPLADNKQEHSRRGGGGRRSGGAAKKNEGNGERQEKAEERRSPAAAPEKKELSEVKV